ncbi:MAG: TetR/AcrR family transcriptional regulator [Sphingomonadales bacterium]
MPQKPPRSRVVQAMTDVFQRHGYEGASLSAIGAASGLSKAGLYHHFPAGKSDMAAQVLAQSGQRFTQLILAPLRSSDPAAQRFATMLDGLTTYYRDGSINCLMNTLSLGDGLDLFGPQIRSAIEAWVKLLAPTLEELGVDAPEPAARRLIAQIHGILIQTRLFEDPDLFHQLIETLRRRYR